MIRPTFFHHCVSIACFLATPLLMAAQPEAMQSARELASRCEEAFNQGDAKALADLYAEDISCLFEGGLAVEGREAAKEALETYFKTHPKAQLEMQVETAKWLTPEVLADSGTTAVIRGDGNRSVTRYSSIWVTEDGKLRLAKLEESAVTPADEPGRVLGDLEWMLGSWKDQDGEVTCKVSYTANDRFLLRAFKVLREGAEPLEASEVIGYDPSNQQIRSWMFDSDGGFGEGVWRNEGEKWLVSMKSTLADGSLTAAQHVISRQDSGNYTWESLNRTINGEALPNLDRVEVVKSEEP
jgi:uncharacterized protein (TIGR02246 family)